MKPATDTLEHLQYLRGIAALMVVFHHALVLLPEVTPAMQFGARGVDIFFVISGFIMAHTLNGRSVSATDFIVKRVIRIVPLYWLALVLVARKDILAGNVFPDLAMDFLFIPHFAAGQPGNIYPALVPGWTLNYEMFFYVLLALAIAFTRHPRVAATIALGGLVLAGAAAGPFDSAAAIFYTSPMVLLFAFGMGVAALFARQRWHSPRALVLVLALALVTVCLPIDGPRLLTVGVPSAVAVYAAACLSAASNWRSATLALLGNASYSIYLFHGWGHTPGRPIARMLGIDASASGPMIALGILIFCLLGIVIGIAAYRWIEQPLLRICRKLWERRPPGSVQVAA